MIKKTTRTLHATYAWREARHAGFRGGYLVPRIRISGKWLGEAGFNIGDELTMNVEHGRLTITKKGGPPIA